MLKIINEAEITHCFEDVNAFGPQDEAQGEYESVKVEFPEICSYLASSTKVVHEGFDCGNQESMTVNSSTCVYNNGKETPSHYSIPKLRILDGRYYQVLYEKSKANSVVALCKPCLPKRTEIRGFSSSTSNFVKHLRNKHTKMFESYVNDIKKRTSNRSSKLRLRNEEARFNNNDSFSLQSAVNILDGTYYQILREKSNDNEIVAICTGCLPEHTEIRGDSQSSPNFRSHLKMKHPETYENYLCGIKRISKSPPVSRSTSYDDDNEATNFNSPSFQAQFESDVTKFFISSMIPLRTIEDPYFTDIFKNLGLQNKISMINQRTLTQRIDELFEENLRKTKDDLRNIKFICISADIWSFKTKIYLIVTAHWITDHLKRKSAMLTCRRLPKTNVNNTIVMDILKTIYLEYDIDVANVVATKTNNYRNAINILKRYTIARRKFNRMEPGENEEIDTNYDSDSTSDEDENTELSYDVNCVLPNSISCCAHMLSLCIAKDMADVISESQSLFAIHKQVISKCNFLWNATTKSSVIIERILGHQLSKPEKNPWNSVYQSLQQILSIKDKTAELEKALGADYTLDENDFLYIDEHLKCTKPLVEAISILQNDIFYGVVLPCLLALRRKLRKLKENQWKYCDLLVKRLNDGIENRFSKYFDFKTREAETAAIAAFSFPRFKNRWLTCIEEIDHERLYNVFKSKIADELVLLDTKDENFAEQSNNDDNDFFDFGESPVTNAVSHYWTKAAMHAMHFFKDRSQDLEVLNSYPEIKKVFLRYNTPLPSSTAVRSLLPHLESYDVSGNMFEKMLILRANIYDTVK